MNTHQVIQASISTLKSIGLGDELTSYSYKQIRKLAEMGYMVTGLDNHGCWAVSPVGVVSGNQ